MTVDLEMKWKVKFLKETIILGTLWKVKFLLKTTSKMKLED